MQASSINAKGNIGSNDVIRESAFHQELSLAVKNGDKSFYNLLLSFMSQDAEDLDQFNQRQSTPTQVVDDLKARLFVQSPPVTGAFEPSIEAQHNQLANQQNVAGITLLKCLKPQPIATEQPAIADDVSNNLDWNVKIKALERIANRADSEPLSDTQGQTKQAEVAQTSSSDTGAQAKAIDVEGWLTALKASRTQQAFLHSQSHQGLELTA